MLAGPCVAQVVRAYVLGQRASSAQPGRARGVWMQQRAADEGAAADRAWSDLQALVGRMY